MPSVVADTRTVLLILAHVGVVVLGGALVVLPISLLVDVLGLLVIGVGARLVSHDLVTDIGRTPSAARSGRRTVA